MVPSAVGSVASVVSLEDDDEGSEGSEGSEPVEGSEGSELVEGSDGSEAPVGSPVVESEEVACELPPALSVEGPPLPSLVALEVLGDGFVAEPPDAKSLPPSTSTPHPAQTHKPMPNKKRRTMCQSDARPWTRLRRFMTFGGERYHRYTSIEVQSFRLHRITKATDCTERYAS